MSGKLLLLLCWYILLFLQEVVLVCLIIGCLVSIDQMDLFVNLVSDSTQLSLLQRGYGMSLLWYGSADEPALLSKIYILFQRFLQLLCMLKMSLHLVSNFAYSLSSYRLWCLLKVQRQISSMCGKQRLTAALTLSRKKLILRKCWHVEHRLLFIWE